LSGHTRDEAEAMIESENFRADLMDLESGWMPLWDGKSELFLRDPFPEELARFEVIRAKHAEGPADIEEGDKFVGFLVPVTDPDDDDDDLEDE
jgi:hypothetical protein